MSDGLPPANRAVFTVAEVVAATGGRQLAGDSDHHGVGVATDTRTLAAGSWFVALSGERFDGHVFIDAALARGATGLIVSRALTAAVPASLAVVEVANTRLALGALAAFHRRRWPGKLLAIGGSAGKTTTRRAVAAVLAASIDNADHVWSTRGNFNNDVGVPLTLLGLTDDHQYAVVEIGTNHRGEVAVLAALAAPNAALLTLIGAEHTEGLGTIEDVAAEEGDLFASVGKDGIILGLADDARVVEQCARSSATRVLYGEASDANVRLVERVARGEHGSTVVLARATDASRLQINTPLLGTPGALATTAAVAACEVLLGRAVDPAHVEAGLTSVANERDGRLTLRTTHDGVVWIDDSYNANPPSMLAGIATAREIAQQRGARLHLVLGEMRELGAIADEEHRRIGAALSGIDVAQIIAVTGHAARYVESAAARASFVADASEAAALLKPSLRTGDVVLLKGSRGVGLERILHTLYPHEKPEHT